MCGITGIFSYHKNAPPVDETELLKIREHMVTRGPDGAGLWVSPDRHIGLAHRRLSIIDLSESGAQPMLDEESGNRIAFNGEIYNYESLQVELKTLGHHFKSTSDTEVLLKLYAEYGQNMVLKLRGMFTLAIWDKQKNGVFLARDPFGIKPLYFADDGKTLRFASQVKALIAGGKVDTNIEPAGHVGFYLWGHVPEPYTFYRGIRSFPPGTSLWIDRSGKREQVEFFGLRKELRQNQDHRQSGSSRAALEELHNELLDSVRHHLIADVPVGVFLSAGLDSTTLVALATQTGVKDLNTITLGFKEFANTKNDEVPIAENVARQYDTRHQTSWIRKEDFSASFTQLLNAMDQPSIDGVNTYFVCQAARKAGLKVALSGLGGDELFGGYSSFREIPRMVGMFGGISKIPGVGRGFCRISAPILKQFTSPKYAGLLEYGGDYAGAYMLRRGLFMPWELPEVLDADLVREGWDELHTLARLDETIDGVENQRLKVGGLETVWYMRNQLLRDADWASMAHSLELRVPLVDVKLFRSISRLVNSGHEVGKKDMAANLANPLPDAVLHRPKTGFSVPVREWLIRGSQDGDDQKQRGLRGWASLLHEKFSQ